MSASFPHATILWYSTRSCFCPAWSFHWDDVATEKLHTFCPVVVVRSSGSRVRFPIISTRLRLTILHTPGHTPEGISILVTDRTRGPEPWFVLTGDTLFAGGVGRPDLLGDGAEARLAQQLYESLFGKLLALPDHLEVYPAHFGGAACGKGLSGKPGSTIGFERRFNPALQRASKAEFVNFVLEDLPPQPAAFAENRRRNLGLE